MTCPGCGSSDTKVTRTIPGAMVSRQHACCSCPTGWWSDARPRRGSIYSLSTGHKQGTSQPSDQGSLSLSPDFDPDSVVSPNRAREPDAKPPEREVFVFPVVGKGESQWALLESGDRELREAFPAIDAMGEYRKALLWLNANPARKKTRRGMPAFLLRWFDKAQNSGRSAAISAPRPATSFAIREEEERRARQFDRRFTAAGGK